MIRRPPRSTLFPYTTLFRSVFITGHPSNQHPVLQVFNDKSWPGFWDSAEKDRLIGAMVAEPDPGKQKQLVDEYQGVIWKEMAFIKCGESFGLRAARKEVKGQVSAAETYYWRSEERRVGKECRSRWS